MTPNVYICSILVTPSAATGKKNIFYYYYVIKGERLCYRWPCARQYNMCPDFTRLVLNPSKLLFFFFFKRTWKVVGSSVLCLKIERFFYLIHSFINSWAAVKQRFKLGWLNSHLILSVQYLIFSSGSDDDTSELNQNLPPTPQKEPEKEGEDGELKKQEMLVQYLKDTETFALQVERAISVINTMLYWKTTSGRRQYPLHSKLM